MSEQQKAELRASLIRAIDGWFSGEAVNGVDMPWIGNNTIAYIADAAFAAILALQDAQEYIQREKIFGENE